MADGGPVIFFEIASAITRAAGRRRWGQDVGLAARPEGTALSTSGLVRRTWVLRYLMLGAQVVGGGGLSANRLGLAATAHVRWLRHSVVAQEQHDIRTQTSAVPRRAIAECMHHLRGT